MRTCEIRAMCPSFGITTMDVEYTVNPIGSKTLYTIHGFHRTERGKRVQKLDVDAVLSFTPYKGRDATDKECIEHKIIEATQGHMRKGIELDNKHLPDPAKTKLKIKRKEIPE